jgi:hypothetical protein
MIIITGCGQVLWEKQQSNKGMFFFQPTKLTEMITKPNDILSAF